MASSAPAPADSADPPDFSLFAGGPFFKLLRRAHLSGEGRIRFPRPVIVITLIVWLPLLVLSALEGHLRGGTVAVPFLADVEAHIRFLVALPLLLIAEVLSDRRMRPLIRQFLDRHLVPDGARSQFVAAGMSVSRLRDSGLEFLLIPLVYGVGIPIVWRRYVAIDAPTWYGAPSVDGAAPTLAGPWYGFVSIPVWQFLLCRWYLRLAIWARFAWQASRIELRLMPAHPDRMGGLGFLQFAVRPFAVLGMAHGALLAGFIANQVLLLKAIPAGFKVMVAAMAAFILVVTVGALVFFAPALVKARRKGLDEYGRLAERYVRGFDAKWLGDRAPDGQLVGSPDIQSLADMANSFQVARTMRPAPISKELLFLILGAMLLPLAPLLLTLVPLEALLTRLVGILF
jgi:hypothetical protein